MVAFAGSKQRLQTCSKLCRLLILKEHLQENEADCLLSLLQADRTSTYRGAYPTELACDSNESGQA